MPNKKTKQEMFNSYIRSITIKYSAIFVPIPYAAQKASL